MCLAWHMPQLSPFGLLDAIGTECDLHEPNLLKDHT